MKPALNKVLYVCLMAGALLAQTGKSAIEGEWQGEMHGLKAVTISIHEDGGRIEGSVIFYVTRGDNGQGLRTVGRDQRKMVETHWDGKTLRFAVGAPDFDPGAPGVRFTMTLTGDKRAELKRLGNVAMTLPVVRLE